MNKENKKQLYIMIADEYEKYIKIGLFKKGDKLPSVREIAYKNGVNPNTVHKSYTLLEQRNLVEIYPKKGVFVIYNQDTKKENEMIFKTLEEFKTSGIKKEELIDIIENIYKEK
ncbi:MAG: GntR family transcriptional regulator [Candidatus Phytoplasma sp.]|nr:GntR family transcriptional regulator [Phytoplasma sp.]